jgi:choice-of-anchor C domain-containing protein
MRIALTIVLCSCAAFGAGFTNGSFEINNNCDAPAGGWRLLAAGSTCITGWVIAAGSVDYSNGLWMASNGIRSVELNGDSVGGISQTFDTLPNHSYRVTFDMAGNVAGPPVVKTMMVNAAGTSQAYSFDSTGKLYTNMGWAARTFTFNSDSSGSTTIQFMSTSTADPRTGPVIDNVVVTDLGPIRSGVLSHIAAGGGWTTVISLINSSSSAVPVVVNLHAEDGSPLWIPVTSIQGVVSQTVTGWSFNTVMNPNTMWLISAGEQMAVTSVGWAEVVSAGVNGFAIFRQTTASGSSEGTVPLQTQFPSVMLVPFDNTGGFVTGLAVANLSSGGATVSATMWDHNGVLLGSQPVTLPGNGHTSFAFPDKLPATAGRRGIVRFENLGGGGLTGLGLRFSPFGTFTSVPTIMAQ